MTVNGQTETVKSAFYEEYAAGTAVEETEFDLYLFRDVFTQFPTEEPSLFVNIQMSESLYGKALDLTKPFDLTQTPIPYLGISAFVNGKYFAIEYDSDPIDVTDEATVESGTLTSTKNGDNFTVRLSIKLSNGNSIMADWEGTATKIEMPE